ncbi:MAG: hypothetical protein GY714_32295 [Desulfobacterales bacterium]|nr:hypothetical protein [Desulfobacterales bacterium]
MPEPKRINIKEFREKGYLQELNRLFLHPLGLALEIIQEKSGEEKLGGVWDYREDPEGIRFGDDITTDPDAIKKAKFMEKEMDRRAKLRKETLGYVVQFIDIDDLMSLDKKT